jgi:hypothetical protein
LLIVKQKFKQNHWVFQEDPVAEAVHVSPARSDWQEGHSHSLQEMWTWGAWDPGSSQTLKAILSKL